jgi:hypothetical protein
MNFLGILLALAIVTTLFGSYCATRSATNTKDTKVDGRDRSKTPYLHFVDGKQFADLYESDSHRVLFRLQDSQAVKEKGDTSPQRVGITLRELEKCIPWVPGDSNIYICGPDGFGPSLLKQVGALHTDRDLFLIEGLPHDLSSIRMVAS